MRRMVWVLTALVLGFGQERATASPIIASATGLPSPTSTITFTEVVLPTDTPLTNQYSGLGVTFAGLYYNAPNASSLTPPMASNFTTGGANNISPFTIFFNQAITGAAFRMQTNPGNSLFEAMLGAVVVESFVAPTTFPTVNDFFGFQGIVFDRIRVTPGGNGNRAAIDNIQIGAPAPEPATLAVFGLMTVGAFGLRRRMKAAA